MSNDGFKYIYKNIDLVTPNKLETSKITNMKCDTDYEAAKCAQFIMKNYNIKNVLITRGEKGLTYVNEKIELHIKTSKIEVYDVSGAGDTLLAVVSSCFHVKDLNLSSVLSLANKAAGIVVGRIV